MSASGTYSVADIGSQLIGSYGLGTASYRKLDTIHHSAVNDAAVHIINFDKSITDDSKDIGVTVLCPYNSVFILLVMLESKKRLPRDPEFFC